MNPFRVIAQRYAPEKNVSTYAFFIYSYLKFKTIPSVWYSLDELYQVYEDKNSPLLRAKFELALEELVSFGYMNLGIDDLSENKTRLYRWWER